MADENTVELLKIPPKSIKNPDYGFSVGRGAFKLTSGSWVTIVQRIKLNDVGEQNGKDLSDFVVYKIRAYTLTLQEKLRSGLMGKQLFLPPALRLGPRPTLPLRESTSSPFLEVCSSFISHD